jgi:hypothetical protein
VTGNLTVNGITTSLNVTNLNVQDNIINISDGTTGTPTQNAGLLVVRGDEPNVQMRWNESVDRWQITSDGITYANIINTALSDTTAFTGGMSVGGNLSVTGSIAGSAVNITAPRFQAVTPSWGMNDSASAAWFLLGTWNTSQAGNCLYMRLIAHCGYNAVANQNQVTELMFAVSNNSSYIAGSSGNFYAAGSASVNSRLGTGGSYITYQAPNKFRIVQVSVTQYQVYAYFGAAYMRNSNYSIQITPGDTWRDGGGNTVSAPGGNYIEITPTSF